MKVWVMESGDYEQRMAYGVFSSPEAAQVWLHKTYADPYIVEWGRMEIDPDGEHAEIVGRFEHVRHKSTRHTAFFDLTKFTIDEGTQA